MAIGGKYAPMLMGLLLVVVSSVVSAAKLARAITDDVEFITPRGFGLGPGGLGPLGPGGFRGIEILPRVSDTKKNEAGNQTP